MNAIIFVDFGMTASGAECLILAGPDDFSPIQQFSTGKIPTKLAYGQDGRVTSWGSGCGAEHRVKSHFKTFFGEDLRSHEHHSTSRPASEHELEKWIADYLRCLGKSLLDHVCQVGPLSKDGLNARWYLTVPGCWSDSTRLDFQMLADQVFQELLPGSSVTANLTEAQASCEFLVDCLQPRPGTWAITCDIGGATCDTALGVIEGDPADCMAQTYPINGTGARTGSVGTIDDCFARHIAVFLRDTNIEDDPKILAQELMLGAEWERARHAFDGENMTVLSLPPGWRVPVAKKQTKPSTDNALTSAQPKISLDGRQLTIPPEVMRKLFADFLKGVYKEIDHALQRLRSELPRATLPISTIVLSGGGGSMAYLLVALRSRWQAYLVTAPATARVSALATLKGSVRHYLNNARKQYLSQIAVGVYSHFPSVVWIKDVQLVTRFDFQSWKHKAVHYFVLCAKQVEQHLPREVEGLKNWYQAPTAPPSSSHSRGAMTIWTLQVALDSHWLGKQKYYITSKCTDKGIFLFEAFDAKHTKEKPLRLPLLSFPGVI